VTFFLLVLLAGFSSAIFSQELSPGSFEFIRTIEGNGRRAVRSITVGPDDSVFVAGITTSSNFVTTPGAPRAGASMALEASQGEVFIRRYSPGGKELLFSTLVGPANFETPLAMTVDGTGNAYIAYRFAPNNFQLFNNLERAGTIAVVKLANDGTRFLDQVQSGAHRHGRLGETKAEFEAPLLELVAVGLA